MTTTQAPAVAHEVTAAAIGGRYPYRPTCSCGWTSSWGYLTREAAQNVADSHKEDA